MSARLQATHAVVNNAPRVISVLSDAPICTSRLFTGSGAPSSSTLAAGNGKYCAAGSGYVVNATVVAVGSGYVVGDVLTVSGGTSTQACKITVAAVTSAGAIQDFYVSQVGIYTAYPSNPVSVTGGTGSSATFNLACQPPDTYFDTNGKNLYICTAAGSNSTSVWSPVTSAPTYEVYNNSHAYAAGSIVQVTSATTILGVTIYPGTYLCISAVPALASGNQLPQYPLPSGTVYWFCIAFGPVSVGSCVTGGNIYVNSTGGF